MTPKERAAMQQALEALEMFAKHYSDGNDAITALREALAEQQITTPDVCGEVCARAKLCYGCNKDLEEANAKYVEQAEQSQLADAILEPVEYLMEVTCKKCGATESGVLKFKDIAQAVNREPIGYTNREWIDWILNDQRPAHACTDALIYKTSTTWSPVALYTTPVRTKDLTDDELRQVLDRNCGDGLMAIARAVIAADREKNK